MHLHSYGICGLVFIFVLHSTVAGSLFPYERALMSKRNFKRNKSRIPIADSVVPDQNNRDDSMNLQDLLSTMSVRPRSERSTKHKDIRTNVILKSIRQILEHKPRKTDKNNNKMKNHKLTLHDIDSIAASDLVIIALAKTRSKRFALPDKVNKIIDDINADSNLAQIALAITRSKRLVRPEIRSTRIDEMNNDSSDLAIALAKTRSKRSALTDKVNKRIDDIHNPDSNLAQIALSKTRSKRYARPEKVNRRIHEINNGRDIVLEAVSKLIENEKTRRRFDMVNPPNSKFVKSQQLLWDRLRIKATEELLLRPQLLPQRATQRVYDTLKMDMELQTSEPTMEPGLFNDMKRKIEKEFYEEEYERMTGREYISTLKPVVYK